MRFQASGSYLAAEADVDPVTTPQSILEKHLLKFERSAREDPDKLQLALLGTSTEDVTLDLYTLVEDRLAIDSDRYISSTKRWIRFATGTIVTNGSITEVTTALPAGGVVYARRTADTITGGQTRVLVARWF